MAHISIDTKPISAEKKKELIEKMTSILAEISSTDPALISVSIHELSEDNMNTGKPVSQPAEPEKVEEPKKKSFFKELFP